MFQDGLDDLLVFDDADDLHAFLALRAGQGIDLVNLLNQPGPVFYLTSDLFKMRAL